MYGGKKVLLTSVVSLLVILFLISAANADDWPCWRGPDRDGISKEVDFLTEWPDGGPKVLWKNKIGKGFSSIAIADGRAYTSGNSFNKDTIFCFDALTGKELWKHTYDESLDPKWYEGGTSATPVVDGELVYTCSKSGKVFCLKVADGSVKWGKDLKEDFGIEPPTWGFSGSAVIIGELVIFNAGQRGIAFDKMTGQLKWQSGKEKSGYASVVRYPQDGKNYILMFGSKALYSLDPQSGQVNWQFEWKTRHGCNAADPIVKDDKVFISSGYGKGCALIQIVDNDVTQVWRNKKMKNHMNTCVLIDGYLYGFDEKTLKCLEFETSKTLWSQSDLGKGCLIAADNKLIILSQKGELVIAETSPKGFKKIASSKILTETCWSIPALANGLLYARDSKGNLVCVDLRKK